MYPTFADWWNSFHQSRAIASYADQVSQIDDADYEQMLKDARAYNTKLRKKGDARFIMTDEERKEYESLLSVDDSGIMGYIDIPKINVSLPIYHGTSEAVLQVAVGHIEGSSLPVGGKGTHCVVSGHRGLPSAKIFTDMDQLQEGDIAQITVLDEILTYEIDQIRSQKAIEYIVSIGENQLTGEDAETEYFIVDLDKPYTTGSGNEQVISTTVFHARKFNIAVEVASYTNDDGEMGCTGNFLAKGDPVEGYFNTSTGVFSVEASETAETPAVTGGN